MNVSNTKDNLLFLPQDQNNVNTLFKHCLAYTKDGNIVLLFTDNTKELLPILKEARKKLSETELKRFLVISVDTLDACINKLCEQHDWAWIPYLIVVDLRTILTQTAAQYANIDDVKDFNVTEAPANPPNCFQQLALCIANLLEYQQSILKRLEKIAAKDSSVIPTAFSILILKEHAEHLTKEQIDLLINLYFYKNNAFDSLEEILDKIDLKNADKNH